METNGRDLKTIKLIKMGRRIKGGYKRANPLACPKNAIKLPACAPCSDAMCEDSATFELGDKLIKGFVYSETGGQIDFPTPVSAEDFAVAYCDAVQSVQTEEGNASYEYEIVAGAEVDGNLTTIYHVGQTTVSALVLDDDSQIEMTRKCTLVNICKYEQYHVGAGAQIVTPEGTKVLEGTATYTLGDDAANQTAAEALSAAVAACLETLGTDYESVSVTPDDTNEGFTITVEAEGAFSGSIGGKKFENCGCTMCYGDDEVEEAVEVVEEKVKTADAPKPATSTPATSASKDSKKS